jgi:glycine/D-amino acid oxidase-like deaminating enzyme
MTSTYDILVIGAGICGVTAALELRARGHSVALIDPGPLPHPLAASTDISKAVRMDYGADEHYMQMGEVAREGWLRWNAEWDEPLYHEIGMFFLTRAPMAPGGFEYESYQLLLKRGHKPERLSSDDIARRFPAWNSQVYVDGFLDHEGGYAESGRVVETLIRQAERAGVALHPGQEVTGLIEAENRVIGAATRAGNSFHAGQVVLAVGAWTPVLVPEMASVFRPVGHPVFHVKVDNPDWFTPPQFGVFAADIARTGWYGFPLHPRQGVVKIANHGVGLRLHPVHDERVVTQADEQAFRAFLAESFPSIADAPIVYTRRCLYCDTPDEHFWIGGDGWRTGLTIAAGDSGHGFKFAPLWGGWIADAVEGKPNPHLAKFQPRTFGQETAGQEAARYHGS